MRILISGGGGLIGSALARHLRASGRCELANLTRRPGHSAVAGMAAIGWDPSAGSLAPSDLEGFDAVVHLAGENIAGARWNSQQKQRIIESRTRGTQLLSERLSGLAHPPRLLLSASAVGYFGHRGDEPLDEESTPGKGFLPEVAQAWEAATGPAEAAGIRVVHLRIATVLAREGGALPRMLPPFRLGLGARLGSGRQWMSWIAIDDLVRAIEWLLDRHDLAGAVHATAPQPVTNAEFTRTLARVLHRPALFAAPAPLLRLLFGEMAGEALLASTRALPQRLTSNGFDFRYPSLEEALRALTGDER